MIQTADHISTLQSMREAEQEHIDHWKQNRGQDDDAGVVQWHVRRRMALDAAIIAITDSLP